MFNQGKLLALSPTQNNLEQNRKKFEDKNLEN